jgi:SAM-dependent methyltransferase
MATTLQISGTPAEIYEEHMVPAIFARWAPDRVETAGMRTGEYVLDAACGTGAVTRLLAGRVAPTGKVVGLDINPGMLAVARRAIPDPNVEWLESSAIETPLPDASFDAVVCQQGLQFFSDRPAALAEMHRALKRDGRLALSCWRSIEHTPGYLALEQALARRIGPEKRGSHRSVWAMQRSSAVCSGVPGSERSSSGRGQNDPVPICRAPGQGRGRWCANDEGVDREGRRDSPHNHRRGYRGNQGLRGRRRLGDSCCDIITAVA